MRIQRDGVKILLVKYSGLYEKQKKQKRLDDFSKA